MAGAWKIYDHTVIMAADYSGIAFSSLEILLYVRGHHIYKNVWEPTEGEVLQLRREPSNPKDWFAVAVYCEDNVVGHVPFSLAPTLSRFLQRECNSAAARIAGSRLNRGGGFGLEVPCVYVLNGPKVYVDRVKELLPPSS